MGSVHAVFDLISLKRRKFYGQHVSGPMHLKYLAKLTTSATALGVPDVPLEQIGQEQKDELLVLDEPRLLAGKGFHFQEAPCEACRDAFCHVSVGILPMCVGLCTCMNRTVGAMCTVW